MKLDIITPLYKSKYLSRLLSSISSSKYVNDINVILINDGDGTSYSQIDQFPILSITYLSYEQIKKFREIPMKFNLKKLNKSIKIL